MSGRDGRLPSSSRPHHGGSHHTSSRDNGRSRDKDRREIVVEPERGASGERKPHKPSVGLGPSGSRLWPPEEQEEEQEEDGEVPSLSKVGLPPLSEGRRSSGNSATGNPNPNPNRNPSPNPYRNPSPNHNPNPHRNPSPNPYRNPSPSHNPNPNPSPSTNPSSNLNPNRNPSPNHNCNPNPNPSTSTNPNPNPNRNRNLSPNPNHNPSPNPSSSPSPKINSNSNRNPSPNHNPSPSNNPNLYPNPSPSPNPNPNSNPNPSPSPGTGPSRLRVSRRSSVEKEPGELSSGSSSEDSGAEMDRPSCSPKRPLPDSSSGGASPYRKRKYSPIVWDLDEKNQKSASSSLPLPPPPPLLPPHLQTTPNPPSHPPAVSRPRLTSCSPSPHAGSDGKLELGQLLSSPRSMDEKEEKEEEEEEESMPHINIAASRWADEEEDNDLSPPREEKASKRVKGWSRSIDNGRNGGNGGNSLLDNGMAREGSEEYPQEKTELIGVGGGGAGVDNRDEEDRDFSNEELYERERNEKEFGDDEDMASEDEAEQRSEDLEEEETRPTIPPAPPQRAIDMLQGCRSVDEFERLNKINEGTYGVVYRARNKKTGEIVALKKVKMEREREGFPLTSLREINVLLSFHHPSIVDVKEVVVGSNLDSIFMVMEYMEHDLKGLMETMKQPFSQSEVKCLMLQLLEGVKYLHDNWVLHRDLKTSNLLLNNCGELKICDFGLARQYGSPLKSYTHMVVTLWYRAPELLLGAKQYSTALDMWSVGCIMAELLSKEPLINGKNELDQLDKIFKTLGTPSEKIWPDLPKLSAKCNFTRQPYNRLKEKFPQTSFSGRPTLSLAGLDLLNRFLTYDPKKRITAEEALQHEWFKEVPLPSMKELMPTFPARSEHERRVRRLMKSPDPLEEQRKRELLQAQLGPIGLFG